MRKNAAVLDILQTYQAQSAAAHSMAQSRGAAPGLAQGNALRAAPAQLRTAAGVGTWGAAAAAQLSISICLCFVSHCSQFLLLSLSSRNAFARS